MAGKTSKSVKQKPTKQKKPATFDEKLSDTKSSMDKIITGEDQGYHLR